MRRSFLEEEQNPIELSFLDVMSCGMIAAMFLALVFSVIGEVPPQELKSMPYLDMIVEIENTDSSVGVAFRTKADSQWIVLPMEQFDLKKTGMLRETAFGWHSRLATYGKFQLLGFKPFFRSKRVSDNSSDNIRMIVHVENPVKGEWEFAVFRRDPDLREELPPPIKIQSLAFSTSSESNLDERINRNASPLLIEADKIKPFKVDVKTIKLDEK